jgi:dodecin
MANACALPIAVAGALMPADHAREIRERTRKTEEKITRFLRFVRANKRGDERVFARLFTSRNVLARYYPEGFNVFMSDNIYKKIELVGSSPNGIEDAVNNAISRAGKTIRNMGWFEVAEVRGHIEDNKVAHWQVTVKVGFTLES